MIMQLSLDLQRVVYFSSYKRNTLVVFQKTLIEKELSNQSYYYSLFVYFCRTLTKNFLKSTKPIDTRFSGQPNINKNPPKIYFLSLSGGWLINYYISLVIINNSFIMFTVTICQRRIVLIPKALPVLFGGGKSDFGYKRKG